MTTKPWLDSNTRVWAIGLADGPLFLSQVGVDLIDWPDKAIISGILPQAAVLDKLPNGITFEILLYPEGTAPDVYDNGEVITKLTACRIKKRITMPVALSPSYDNRIKLELTIDCDIELLIDMPEYENFNFMM